MTFTISRRHSLKARVALLTLAIFLVGIWSLALYADQMLHEEMEVLLGKQQLSTASIVAASVNQSMEERLRGLDVVAAGIGADLLGNPVALQAMLEQRPVLQTLFNAGVFVVRADGTAVADVPSQAGRIGVNYMDRGNIASVLKGGEPTISRPLVSKTLGTPLFGMSVAIRDQQGLIIGALVGSTDLGKTNFLDKIAGNSYGKTGGYLVVAPKFRQIVTATDKRRAMEILPASGVNPKLDRFLDGYEGSAVFTAPTGVPVLASVISVPIPGWAVAAVLPTEEAFAPLRDVQRRLVIVTALLTLLAGGLVWWMLARQFAPILGTIAQLATMSDEGQALAVLPIARQDEIGQLIGGFNRLLETLTRRTQSLQQSEELFRTLAAVAPIGIYLSDRDGNCLYTNARWCEMAGMPAQQALGQGWVDALYPEDRAQVFSSWKHMVESEGRWGLEYRFQTPEKKTTWIFGLATPLRDAAGAIVRYVGINVDITERKLAQAQLQAGLLEKEALLKEVHHRVKNNLQVITSLLRLESGRSAHLDTRAALGDMQGRIRSMALLHETLYRSGTFAAVDLGGYLKQLSTQAFRAMLGQGGRVTLQLELDSINVGMDQANTCGLLVNELITNCLKHGFPDARSGEVRVSLNRVSDTARVRLRVSDTGVGLGADFQARRATSLGLQLVQDLVTQLGGTLEIGPGDLAGFTVTFAIDQAALTSGPPQEK